MTSRTSSRALSTNLFALLLTILVAAPAAAEVVTWNFAGQVVEDYGLRPGLTPGTPISFRIPVDYGATNMCEGSGVDSGFYSMPGGSGSLGSRGFTWDTSVFEVQYFPSGECARAGSGVVLRLFMMSFTDDDQPASFTSVAMAFTPPQRLIDGALPAFPGTPQEISLNCCTGAIGVEVGSAQLTSGSVPAPAALMPLVLGLVGCVVRRRRTLRA